MRMLFVLELVLLAVSIHAVARVWRANVLHGILMLFLPFYFFYALIRYWSDPDHTIRAHALVLLIGIPLMWWSQQRAIHELLDERAVLQAAQDDRDAAGEDTADDEEASASEAPSGSAPGATIEIGPAPSGRNSAQRPAGARAVSAVATGAQHGASGEAPPPAPAPERSAAPAATLRQARAAATFQRGRFERAGAGFALELPAHFHALSGVDARRIETALGQAPDAREVAWITHESVALDAAGAWHVSVRWLDDGAVAPLAPGPDPEGLLRDAQAAHASSRLAGTLGALIGYAVMPTFAGDRVDWVEERIADGGAASVLDCHALRLGRKGTLEFSVVGAPPGSHVWCETAVRLLAGSARFRDGQEAGVAAARHAPYTLADLVARLH